MPTARPNLLFVMTDHQRADSLGMTQAGVEVTPNLNRVAGEGTVFSRAYDTCPLCVPARTALATGKYPTHNGVVFNDWRGLRAGDHKPLHQCLHEAGYEVGHIGVHHIRVEPTLQDRVPFAVWLGKGEYNQYLRETCTGGNKPDMSPFRREVTEYLATGPRQTKYSSTGTAVWPYEARHFEDLWFCDAAVDFIERDHERPFALFVYLWAPHPPLRVPEPYASRFDPAELDLPPNVGVRAEGEPQNRRRGVPAQLAEGLTEKDWRKVWAAHLGLVNLADDGIGRILRALESAGFAENTFTVFTVDHGEHLGQHSMYQKMEMYEQAIRVPLTVRGPGVKQQKVTTPVSHLDVMPTLLEMLELPAVDDLDGVTLRDVITAGTRAPERPIFCQFSGNPDIGEIRRAVVTERYKYVYDPDAVPELYDLTEDPLEMNNLSPNSGYRATLEQLHQAGKEWAETHGDWVEF